MHFVSEYTETVTVRAHKDNFSQASGEKVGATPAAKIHLPRGVAPEWAVDVARAHFKFTNRGLIEVERYCAYVDTEEWARLGNYDDDLRRRAESLLLAKYPTVIAVDPPKLKPPWPTYDKLQPQGQRTPLKVAERNLELAEETGVPVEDLVTYEKLNRNNPEIVAAYEARIEKLRPSAEPLGDIVDA